jgi:prepilin-type N-terminal cleavage/methylation domain-containing protein
MKMKSKLLGGFTLVELLVVIVIIAALAGLTAPMVIRQRKKADQTEAVNNARQIGLALMDFETEYSTFPDAATGAAVATATETAPITTLDANSRFRQLIRAGIVESESIFYAKTAFTKKPDGVFNTDQRALEPGEVGFCMIVKANGTGLSAAGNPSRPIIIAPSKEAFDGTFDSDYYDGKAVVLKLDNSVTSMNIIRSSGNVINNGKKILEGGVDTVWGDSATGVIPAFSFPQKKQ